MSDDERGEDREPSWRLDRRVIGTEVNLGGVIGRGDPKNYLPAAVLGGSTTRVEVGWQQRQVRKARWRGEGKESELAGISGLGLNGE